MTEEESGINVSGCGVDFELPGEEFRFYSKWMENCWRVIMAVLIIHTVLKTPSGLSLENGLVGVRMGMGVENGRGEMGKDRGSWAFAVWTPVVVPWMESMVRFCCL